MALICWHRAAGTGREVAALDPASLWYTSITTAAALSGLSRLPLNLSFRPPNPLLLTHPFPTT